MIMSLRLALGCNSEILFKKKKERESEYNGPSQQSHWKREGHETMP
jgi:hypothetical protein